MPHTLIHTEEDLPNLLKQKLIDAGFAIHIVTSRASYIRDLVDQHAALILVDGRMKHWQYWVTTAKSSPATRRIPVIVYADVAESLHAEAHQVGADVILSQDELLNKADSLIREYVQALSAEAQQQLECDCLEALPEAAQHGITLFNAGEYYQQHDVFEALWMQTHSPIRDFYRAILQVGVAYYQIQRGNGRGARKILLRSRQWLNRLPDVCQGVDVAALRADANKVYTALSLLPDDDLSGFDSALLQPVKAVQSGS